MLWLPCLLLVVIAAGPAAPAAAEERPLRFVTFNVLHGRPWSWFTGDDM